MPKNDAKFQMIIVEEFAKFAPKQIPSCTKGGARPSPPVPVHDGMGPGTSVGMPGKKTSLRVSRRHVAHHAVLLPARLMAPESADNLAQSLTAQ